MELVPQDNYSPTKGDPEADKDIIRLINKRMNESWNFCEDYFESAKGYYKLYRSYKDKKKNKWESNIFVPYTFTLIENSVAREMTTEFSKSPFCSVVTVTSNPENDDITEGLQTLINHYLEDPDYEFYLEYMDHLKNQKIYGNGTITVYPKMDMNDPLKKFIGPAFEAREYWDTFPDPACRRATQARFMIYRKLQPWDYIEDKMDEGIYKRFKKSEVSAALNMYFGDKHNEVLTETGRQAADVIQMTEDRYEILDYCSKGDVVTVIGGATKVRDTRVNPMAKTPYNHPFNESRYVTHPGEYFGSGFPEIVKGLQMEINLIRNQRRDNLTLSLNKIFKVQMNEEIDDDDLVSEPGGILRLMNMDNVEQLEVNDVTSNAYQEEDVAKSDIENATGEFSYSRGGTPDRRETATAIVRLQNASQPRFTVNMQSTEINCFRQVCKKVAMLCHKFQDEADMAKIIGPDKARKIKNMPAEDIARAYNYKFANTDLSGLKEMRVNLLSQGLEAALKIPAQVMASDPNPYVISTRPIVERIYRALDFENVEGEIIKDAPPPQPPPPPPGGMPPGGPGAPPPGVNQQINPQQLMAMMAQQGGGQPPQGGPPQ